MEGRGTAVFYGSYRWGYSHQIKSARFDAAFIRTLNLYLELIERHPAQLTILPETALPIFFDQLPPAYLDALTNAVRAHGGNLIAGALSGDRDAYWNSAVTLGTAPSQRCL